MIEKIITPHKCTFGIPKKLKDFFIRTKECHDELDERITRLEATVNGEEKWFKGDKK